MGNGAPKPGGSPGFDKNPVGTLRSLKTGPGEGTFKVRAARGTAIANAGKKDIRPVVLAGVKTCRMQRAIWDVLQGTEDIQLCFRNP